MPALRRSALLLLLAVFGLHCATTQDPAVEAPAAYAEMTVQELHAMRQAGTAPFILDVRNPEEVEIATLGADLFIPLGDLAGRLQELDAYRDRPIVVHCRTGKRSASAAQLLVEAGFTQVINLQGGIQAWSREIDPSVPTY